MKKIFFILSLIFIFSFNLVFVQAGEVEDKVINPVKQFIQERVQEKVEQKTGEIKEEIKQEIKTRTKNWFRNWFQEKLAKVEELLNPLKIKIQEGSNWFRSWFSQNEE